jgi:hypothetical protein
MEVEQMTETLVYIRPGESGRMRIAYSECAMFMRVAGKPMSFRFLGVCQGVQLLNDDGTRFSAPITYGEAGIYRTTASPPSIPRRSTTTPTSPDQQQLRAAALPGFMPSPSPNRKEYAMTQEHPDALVVLRFGGKHVRIRAVSDRQLVIATTMLDPDPPAIHQHDSPNSQPAPAGQDAAPGTEGTSYELRVAIRRAEDCDPSEIVEALDGWALQYDSLTFDPNLLPSDAMLDDACDFAASIFPAVAEWANSGAGRALLSPGANGATRPHLPTDQPGDQA